MKVVPLNDKIVVKRLEAEDKTTGGILLPDTAKEKPKQGKVLSLGEGKLLEKEHNLIGGIISHAGSSNCNPRGAEGRDKARPGSIAARPSEICWMRRAIPKPCIGPLELRVLITSKSSVPCRTSDLGEGHALL